MDTEIIKDLDRKTRKLMTLYGMLHKKVMLIDCISRELKGGED